MADFPYKMLPKYIENNPYRKHLNRWAQCIVLNLGIAIAFIIGTDDHLFICLSGAGLGGAVFMSIDCFRKFKEWENGESPYQYIARMTDFIRSNTYHE